MMNLPRELTGLASGAMIAHRSRACTRVRVGVRSDERLSMTLRTRSRRSSRRAAHGRARRSCCRPCSTCWECSWWGRLSRPRSRGSSPLRRQSGVAVIGAGVFGRHDWNLLTWWRGLPSSSGHALVGGLAGSALAEGGVDAVQWGGLQGWRPVGVLGVLFALAVSPPLGLAFGFAAIRVSRRLLRRASRLNRGAGAGSGVGDVGCALIQPRRERWPEVNGCRRCVAGRERSPADVLGAAVDEAGMRCGADRRHDAGGLADRTYDRPANLPPGSARQLREPERLYCGHPLFLIRRRSSLDDTSGCLLGGRVSVAAGGAGIMSAGPSCGRWALPGSRRLPAAATLGAVTVLVWGAIA